MTAGQRIAEQYQRALNPGVPISSYAPQAHALAATIDLAVAEAVEAERRACEEIAEDLVSWEDILAAIRARGNPAAETEEPKT
jgi:hypothetical protein